MTTTRCPRAAYGPAAAPARGSDCAPSSSPAIADPTARGAAPGADATRSTTTADAPTGHAAAPGAYTSTTYAAPPAGGPTTSTRHTSPSGAHAATTTSATPPRAHRHHPSLGPTRWPAAPTGRPRRTEPQPATNTRPSGNAHPPGEFFERARWSLQVPGPVSLPVARGRRPRAVAVTLGGGPILSNARLHTMRYGDRTYRYVSEGER